MTGYLNQHANDARLDHMRTVAERRRLAKDTAPRQRSTPDPISIRRATVTDRATIERLAALDSTAVPSGELLIAEVAGEAQAAIEIPSGTTIADPFRPTAHLIELLELRAERLRAVEQRPRRFRLRLRTADA